MIYFILKKTISEESLSYQNNLQNSFTCINAKEFNAFNTNSSLAEKLKLNGCDSVAVSIEACGALGPGSIPGRGPLEESE